MAMTINTVTGSITPEQLGKTLMHEHLMIGYPGWDSDSLSAPRSRQEMFDTCVERIRELQDIGVNSLLDPCPNDLGRDVSFMREVAEETGFNIICATGLYKEDQGGAPYWKFRASMGGGADSIAAMFIKEIEEGIGDTGVKAGIIKVATGNPQISDYEKMILEAGAIASKETGAPITTHTEGGILGDEQQEILVKHGVPSHRIIIGHSCGSPDHEYHMRIAKGGSYLGFDRFGLEVLQQDSVRVEQLLKLIKKGASDRVVVSHDSVWCWLGQPFPNPDMEKMLAEVWNPLHFHKKIIPMLKEGGATDRDIEMMLEENPKRFFKGDKLPKLD